ncbi:MAG: helix-turn-helix transcriptional regulator [Clostridia bacterium]|nr:helix-turn-helix transcriptional regulator [Clostridia bacterium]
MLGLGEKIRAEREELGFTQSDMARAIPMNQSNYSKIERDMQEPSIEQFKRICEILKLDANYLLDVDEGDIPKKDRELLKAIKTIIKKYQ